MREPLDPDDCCVHWNDPANDEIKKLIGDNRALRMLLKDCKGELIAFQAVILKGLLHKLLFKIGFSDVYQRPEGMPGWIHQLPVEH